MNTVVTIAGHFEQTINRAIIEMIINVTVSLIGVYYFGIYGVLIGTIVALAYRSNDFVLYANKQILDRSPKKSYFRWIFNTVFMVIIIFTFNKFNISFIGYMDFFLQGIIIFCAIFIITIILNSIIFKEDFNLTKTIIKERLFAK